ncbi:MAG: hypothetical protein WCO71_03285, partial [Pseudomonadota bacterium]
CATAGSAMARSVATLARGTLPARGRFLARNSTISAASGIAVWLIGESATVASALTRSTISKIAAQ